jgi:hypothetical protein
MGPTPEMVAAADALMSARTIIALGFGANKPNMSHPCRAESPAMLVEPGATLLPGSIGVGLGRQRLQCRL